MKRNTGLINELRNEVNHLGWWSRRTDLEMHGIRKSESKTLLGNLNTVATKLDVSDLEDKHMVSNALERWPGARDYFTICQ